MNPKNNPQTRLVINPDVLIHDRPDMRGGDKETVEEYLARGGEIITLKPNLLAESKFRKVRQNFKFQNQRRG